MAISKFNGNNNLKKYSIFDFDWLLKIKKRFFIFENSFIDIDIAIEIAIDLLHLQKL